VLPGLSSRPAPPGSGHSEKLDSLAPVLTGSGSRVCGCPHSQRPRVSCIAARSDGGAPLSLSICPDGLVQFTPAGVAGADVQSQSRSRCCGARRGCVARPVGGALRGPLCTPPALPTLHTRPHNQTPRVARPTQHPSRASNPAHQAPQPNPKRCEAHSAPLPHSQPCTPGPTTKPHVLRGPLSTPPALPTLHTRPHNQTPRIARPTQHPSRASNPAHQAPQPDHNQT
jgi:hypothetical protein